MMQAGWVKLRVERRNDEVAIIATRLDGAEFFSGITRARLTDEQVTRLGYALEKFNELLTESVPVATEITIPAEG